MIFQFRQLFRIRKLLKFKNVTRERICFSPHRIFRGTALPFGTILSITTVGNTFLKRRIELSTVLGFDSITENRPIIVARSPPRRQRTRPTAAPPWAPGTKIERRKQQCGNVAATVRQRFRRFGPTYSVQRFKCISQRIDSMSSIRARTSSIMS